VATAYVTDAGAVVTGQTGAIGDTVTPIDLKTDKAGTPITVGNGPIAIAIEGDVAYVANSGSESVSPIDLATNTVGAAVAVGGPPQALAAAARDVWVVVSNGADRPGSLTPIGVSTNATGTPVTVGKSPASVAIARGKAYVVCADSIVTVDLSGVPTAEPPFAVANGPYALALYSVRAR
jgi:hyaluronoglucosaminidase